MADELNTELIFFDVGGVLVSQRPNPREFMSIIGLNDSAECVSLVDKAIWAHRDAYDEGMSDLDFWDAVSGDCGLPQPSEDQVRKLVTADASRMHAIDEAAAHLLSDLRTAGYNIGLLTNMPATHASVVMESVWAQRYINGPMIFSSHVGIRKPNRGIYREALASAQQEPQKLLYIDDRSEYVKAAEYLDIPALTWENADALREDLKKLGVL